MKLRQYKKLNKKSAQLLSGCMEFEEIDHCHPHRGCAFSYIMGTSDRDYYGELSEVPAFEYLESEFFYRDEAIDENGSMRKPAKKFNAMHVIKYCRSKYASNDTN